MTLARLPHFPASFGSSLTSSNLMVHLRILSYRITKSLKRLKQLHFTHFILSHWTPAPQSLVPEGLAELRTSPQGALTGVHLVREVPPPSSDCLYSSRFPDPTPHLPLPSDQAPSADQGSGSPGPHYPGSSPSMTGKISLPGTPTHRQDPPSGGGFWGMLPEHPALKSLPQ